MKRTLFILLTIAGCCQLTTVSSQQPYMDDSYYWPERDTVNSSLPVYDKNIREFIFLEDTTQHPDTVRMRIIEK